MSDSAETGYRVLARKYRPETFADLIGQDVMVRTLKNAFASDRIAQAFIMTGIRGTGKTTTARIIAKGLNCIGVDGQGGPTTEPCGICEPCQAISEGRHVDVMEMDAASRTGVGDIREIIDSVHYRAASARYKIYIIDEVHMLSTSAFNALLKTLEEPPEHVKFIFATTEIRKVPVTVLSRCQRFDLRRIEPEVMIAHLRGITEKEKAAIADDALALITRAAEGSVRDAMSLLDQAISHGAGTVDAGQVRAMLGLADRGRVLDLFEHILRGRAAEALAELSAQYADGADPLAVLRDLAEITHWVSVIKISPEAAEDPTVAPEERSRGRALAEALAMRVLTRMWQMLLKALEEVAQAPNAMMAAEMAVIRLTHVADLPDPEMLIRRLQEGGENAEAPGSGRSSTPPGGATAAAPLSAAPPPRPGGQGADEGAVMTTRSGGGAMAQPAVAAAAAEAVAPYPDFAAVVALIRAHRDMKLLVDVETGLRLVRYAPGRIEFEPAPDAPADLAARLSSHLRAWTGQRWAVSVVAAGGAPTLAETRAKEKDQAVASARTHPLVQALFAAFPKARVTDVRKAQPLAEAAALEALPALDDEAEADEDWDPFEDN